MTQIRLAGRDIPIKYNLRAMSEMERTIGRSTNVIEQLKGENRVEVLVKLVRIMAKGAGETVEENWLWDNLTPAEFLTVYIQVMNAYSEGMRMEVDITDGKPVDIGLQEIKKKKGAD